jgi:hypothetical protein
VEIGGLNIVEISLFGAQAGLLNIIGGDIQGMQIGLILNSNRGNMQGAQIGIVNLNDEETIGFQAGLLNASGGDFAGVQAGGFNYSGGSYAEAFQFGLCNLNTGLFSGTQTGFANISLEGLQGRQLYGVVNYAGDFVEGAQLGIINVVTGSLTGVQWGLLNYAESIDYGMQLGLISVVRDGGYFAFETGISNIVTTSFRMISGSRNLYSIISAETNIAGMTSITEDIEFVAASFGLGAIFNLGYEIYFIQEGRFYAPVKPLLLPVSLFESNMRNDMLEMMAGGVIPFSIMSISKIGISFCADS